MSRLLATTSMTMALMLGLAAGALALPQGGQVAGGAAAIAQPDAATTTVTQSTNRAIIDWTAFDVGAGESVLFTLPDASGITLNRVTGGNASQIYGRLSSNGKLWLINPQGIVFGQGAQVNVGSLLATTGALANGAFMNGGPVDFTGATGSVANNGTIATAPGGYAILAAPTVANTGSIDAPQGQINLAAATGFRVDPVGDNLLTYAPDPSQFALTVANTGTLRAQGGRIALTTQATDAALASVVNAGGVIAANGFQNVNGHIVLGAEQTQLTKVSGQVRANGATGDAGTVDVVGQFVDVKTGALIAADAGATGNGGGIKVIASKDAYMSGALSARGGSTSGNGGFIETSGHRNLSFRGTADTAAPHGQLGMLLLDPTDITIADGSGGADDTQLSDDQILAADGGASAFTISEAALEAIAGTSNITLEATNDITLDNLSDNLLNLQASTGGVIFRADSDNNGSGDFTATAADTIATAGGNLSIAGANLFLGNIDTSAGNGGVTLAISGGGGSINLLGNIQGGSSGVTLTGPAALQTNLFITTADGPVAFNGAVTGAHILTVNAGTGTASLLNGGAIDSLALSSGATALGGTLATKTDMDFSNGGPVALAADTALASINGGTRHNITFGSGGVNGAHALALTGANVTLPGAGGGTPLSSLAVDANSAATIGNVATSGHQTYTGNLALNGTLASSGGNITTGAITMAGNTTLSTAGGNVATGAITGANALTVTAGGTANLGGTTAASVAVTSAGGTTLAGVNTTGAQTYNGPTSLNGAYQATGGAIAFNGATTLAGNSTVDTAGGNTNVTFGGTVDGARSLAVATGTGTAAFTGAVGGSTPLASLAVTGNTSLAGNVTTAGAQTYTGPLALGGNAALAAANADLTITGATTGAHTLTLAAGSGDLHTGALTVDTLTLASADDLFLGGNITTQTALDFTAIDDIILSANVALTSGPPGTRHDITMNGGNQLSGAFNLALVGDTLTLGTVNNVNQLTLTGTTGSILANAVATTGAVTVNGPATFGTALTTTADAVTFNGATTLSADSSIATAGGAIGFASTINGAHALTLNSGAANTTLSGAAGNITPLTTLDVTAGTFSSNGITLSGDLATSGNSVFNGATAANNIDLIGTNTINAPMTALTNLSILGGTQLGGNLTAGNNLTINGNLLLTADSTLANGGTGANLFRLQGDISGAHAITFTAGTGDLTLIGDADVGTITFASGNNFNYGGGTLQAANGLDFTPLNQILLSGDTSFVGGGGGTRANVTAGVANSVLATSGGIDLAIYGDTVSMNQLGDAGSGRLESLTIDANIASLLGNIYTNGAQTITAQQGLAGFLTSNGGDIVLNTTANLVGDIDAQSHGGNIYINQPLNGHYAMRLDASAGNVYINAALGNVDRLTTMDIYGALIELNAPISTLGDQNYNGTTHLNTALTLTLGNITYHDPVTLTGNTTLDTSGGNGTITFQNAVDGNANLTLRTGALGNVLFADTAGAGTRLGTLTVDSAHDITFTKGVYATNYLQADIEGLAYFGYAPGLDVTDNILVGVSHDLEGRFTGRDIVLTAGNSIVGEVYAANSLTLTSNRTLLTGTVRGQPGRIGARMVGFGSFYGGPHYFGGQNLPVVDDFYALPSLVAKSFAAPGSPTGQPIAIPGANGPLNPFLAQNPLLLASAAARAQGGAPDVFGTLFPDQFGPTQNPDPLAD